MRYKVWGLFCNFAILQLTVGKGAPLPITEEASQQMSSHQNDNSSESAAGGEFIPKKKRSVGESEKIESSDVLSSSPGSPSRKDKRFQKLLAQNQKALSNAKSLINQLTRRNTASVDESSSNSVELDMRHSKIVLGTPDLHKYSICSIPRLKSLLILEKFCKIPDRVLGKTSWLKSW